MSNAKTGSPPKVDYHEILQVSKRASREVIHAAYLALAKKHHPNVVGSNTVGSRFMEIKEAYDTLSNDAKKTAYEDGQNKIEGRVIGDYRIIKEIATGGFGTTYLGEHILLGEKVCFKHCSQVDPELERILLAEAKAVWDLRHYSLPVMRDMLRMPDGSLVLVMSYIPGYTMEQIVTKAGKMEPEHVGWFMERALNALKYLHLHGVVHGDIKPQNMIIQHEDHMLVLVDFGLAMVKPSSSNRSLGYTPVFSSPEEMRGGTLVPESDLYSLGMTMIYALCGGDEQFTRKRVPNTTPQPLVDFIRRLVVNEVTSRPHWGTEDLCETISKVRQQSFGRTRSNMKPIAGL